MRILVVCQYYKPEPFRISDICEALVERGHDVTVVTGTPNYPEGEIYPGYEGTAHQDELIQGVRVHRCPIHPRKRGALHRFWNYYSFVFASERYLWSLKDDFDVVFVNQLSPVMMAESAIRWAKRHGKRTVLYCLDLWPESLCAGGIHPGSLIYRIFYRISRRIYRRADEILVTSKGFETYFRETLKLCDARIDYLPQYAEALFDDVPPVQQHEPPYHFTFAGNVGEMQSVETIVGAAQRLSDDMRVHFDIVGDGVLLEKCRVQAAGLDNITFHGRRGVEEMPAFYAQADAMLLTLCADDVISLTLPGKVQSYLSSGRAIVGAIDGEAPLVVAAADCGVCVNAENSAALADAIRAFVDAPERFLCYGAHARHYAQQYFRKDAFLDTLIQALSRSSGE